MINSQKNLSNTEVVEDKIHSFRVHREKFKWTDIRKVPPPNSTLGSRDYSGRFQQIIVKKSKKKILILIT